MHLDDVYVDSVERHDKVSLIRGRFRLGEAEYPFSGIAYMGYGGPNLSVELGDDVRSRVQAAGLGEGELELLVVELQRRLINGDFKLAAEK